MYVEKQVAAYFKVVNNEIDIHYWGPLQIACAVEYNVYNTYRSFTGTSKRFLLQYHLLAVTQ